MNKYDRAVQIEDYSYFEFVITNVMFGFYWVLYLMNLWWFYKLVQGAMKFLKEEKKGGDKSDDYKKVEEGEKKSNWILKNWSVTELKSNDIWIEHIST